LPPGEDDCTHEAEEIGSGRRGLLSLATGPGATGAFPALPPGDYQLRLEAGEAVLFAPEGTDEIGATLTPFQTLTTAQSGEAVLTDPPEPFSFSSGQRYRFTVRAASANRGTSTDLDLGRTALVTAVRIRDGVPVIVADGIEVDPSRIKSIRE